jgi:hypothetical protein
MGGDGRPGDWLRVAGRRFAFQCSLRRGETEGYGDESDAGTPSDSLTWPNLASYTVAA